jgi:hypothetical protein
MRLLSVLLAVINVRAMPSISPIRERWALHPRGDCNPKLHQMCPGNVPCPQCGKPACACPTGPTPPPGPPSPAPTPPAPPSPGPKFKCGIVIGKGCVISASGTFTSKTACDASCSAPPPPTPPSPAPPTPPSPPSPTPPTPPGPPSPAPTNCDGPNGLIATATKQLDDANVALGAANANMTNTTRALTSALAQIVTKQKGDNVAVIQALNASNAANLKNDSAFVALENAQNALKALQNTCKQPKAPSTCPGDLAKAQVRQWRQPIILLRPPSRRIAAACCCPRPEASAAD